MLVSGTILRDSYTIVRLIAQGGMGAVYLAKHRRLGSTVAVKQTFFDDASMLKAFEREARLLAGLRHPALPKVTDHFPEGDGWFLVMEFIAGDDLGQMLKERGAGFPFSLVTHWGDQLLGALEYLHKQTPPVIHRDIKPQNVKLTEEGQIVLLDFGLAKGQAEGMSRMTAGHSVRGFTPNYAPLEQIRGVGTDGRSDLYSLAATLYHLMTGFTPVDALSRAAVVVTGQPDPLRPANALNSDVPQPVADILMQAMSQNCDHRPASAAVMRRMLRDAMVNELPRVIAPSALEIAATLPMASEPHPPTGGHLSTQKVPPPSLDTVVERQYRQLDSADTPNPVHGTEPKPLLARARKWNGHRERMLSIVVILIVVVAIIVAAIAVVTKGPNPIANLALSVASFICFIIVLVKMFQTAGVLQGILGLFCGLWCFIWGWMNAGKLGIKNIMLIWTVLIILSIVLGVAGGGFSYKLGTP